ncbi:MAG TPA: ROK family transcriptional regulator [Roseiarcus sp.]|jgi:predicted NBD/HSP70 family sugar kinase|nr:ROK family transcriptional regulator [Roseiarcus sp.]
MDDYSAYSNLPPGCGAILSLIASGKGQSRSALAEASGLSRSTVAERLAALFATGFVEESAEAVHSGGRPARKLRLNKKFGIVLVANIGETHVHLAATDLEPAIVAETVGSLDVRSGPETILAWIASQFRSLLEKVGRSLREVVGIGLGMPAPVDYDAARVFGPSVMLGWDDFDIRGWMRTHFDAPVLVENDVNLMTLSEFRRFWPDVGQFLFIKAGTGIGSGIITDGRIYRGAQGAAGDIGHIQFASDNPPLCRCGKLGCVEARAAGWALARDLRARGFKAQNARDIVELVRINQPEAIQLVRGAGRILGEVSADVVSVLNPAVIVIGGTLAEAGEHLLSGVRELVYQRSLPLATRKLQIAVARSNPGVGLLLGAAQLVIESQLAPAAVEQTIARHQRLATEAL